jgi:hypothetical protein
MFLWLDDKNRGIFLKNTLILRFKRHAEGSIPVHRGRTREQLGREGNPRVILPVLNQVRFMGFVPGSFVTIETAVWPINAVGNHAQIKKKKILLVLYG